MHKLCLAGSEAVEGKHGSERHTTSSEEDNYCSPFQAALVTVENVRISGIGTLIIVLPESVILPSGGQRSWAASIASEPQRVIVTEPAVVAGAQFPPTGASIDNWVPMDFGVVGVGEVTDPGNHSASAQAVTFIAAVWIVRPADDWYELVDPEGER